MACLAFRRDNGELWPDQHPATTAAAPPKVTKQTPPLSGVQGQVPEQSPRQWRRRRLVFAAADQPQQEEEERWLVGALANGGAVAVMAVMVVMEDMAMAVAVAMGRVVMAPAALDAQEVTAAMDRRQ